MGWKPRRIEYEYITSKQGIECVPVYVACLYPVGLGVLGSVRHWISYYFFKYFLLKYIIVKLALNSVCRNYSEDKDSRNQPHPTSKQLARLPFIEEITTRHKC
jgi:hypothetical protein